MSVLRSCSQVLSLTVWAFRRILTHLRRQRRRNRQTKDAHSERLFYSLELYVVSRCNFYDASWLIRHSGRSSCVLEDRRFAWLKFVPREVRIFTQARVYTTHSR